jgi:hypothetical protein
MNTILRTLCMLCILTPTLATPYFSAIFYDPPGADSGFEYIELYCSQACNYTGLELWFGNGDKPQDWTKKLSFNLTLPAKQFFVIGESNVTSDLFAKLTIGNGPDSVKLVFENQTLDLVGYGSHEFEEYYQDEPASDVTNIALVRINNTGSNALDFQGQPYIPHPYYLVKQDVSYSYTIDALPLVLRNLTYTSSSVVDAVWYMCALHPIDVIFDALHTNESANYTVRITNSTGQVVDIHSSESPVIRLSSCYPKGNYTLVASITQANTQSNILNQTVYIEESIAIHSLSSVSFTSTNTSTYAGELFIQTSGNVALRVSLQALDSQATIFYKNQSLDKLSQTDIVVYPHTKTRIPLTLIPSATARTGTYTGSLVIAGTILK